MAYPLVVTERMMEHPADSHTMERYEATGGYQAARQALGQTRDELVEVVKASGLLGRGGAAFSAGLKWSFLAPARPAYLVVNGDESEPGTFKDRQLLERDPHQLIEGMIIAAKANEVYESFIYIRGEYPKPARRVQQAVVEAYAKGYLGKGIFGTDYNLELTVHLGAGAYICGEETALLNSLEGRRGEPRLKPPYFPAAKGLYMKPTIVNNVETIANLPHIINKGAEWFSGLSDSEDTGTFMMSISGHVNKPGNYELPHGLTWRQVIYDVAGGIRNGNELKAWVPGGASAPWFVPDLHLDRPITKAACAEDGSMLGSGAIIVMDHTTDMVGAAERLVAFFAEESCGQCTPCREGTTWLDMILQRVLDGAGRDADIDLLLDLSDNISVGLAWPPKQTTICPLGPSAVSPVMSLVRHFRDEVEAHIAKGIHSGGQGTPVSIRGSA
ncbi:MAG: NADH-quinone oxidoreductase subunit NuoF [Acidimicrobiia bacterium]|nr:NADH-quinone oxidoreductase subunit NuoF [Acidimicrobiia bacterium]MDH5502739.1 NADH-quinone oxidoreductase subunit NuoF [Acidimicrobiia bacterium]